MDEASDETPGQASLWRPILAIGGACWAVVALLAWLAPWPCETAVAAAARLMQYLLVFVAAAGAYRATLALGWPQGRRGQLPVLFAGGALALLVVGCAPLALLPANLLVRQWLQPAAARPAPVALGWAYWGPALRLFLVPYLLGLTAIGLAVARRGYRSQARRTAQLAHACASARMTMLSAQLQPHFLFNALHAISVLVDDSPRRAAAMIARLGDFLRHALESSRWPWTDLASELAGVEAYLAVQQMRFADALSVCLDASAQALAGCIPALLLQPLVENAIEHGRNDTGTVLQVRIAAAVMGGRLCIVVSNSSSRLRRELSPADFGHGLNNVELRLRAAYGGDAQLSIGPHGPGGTAALLNLPWREFFPARFRARAR